MNHDECVALVVEQGVKQDQIQTDEWDGLPYFTPANPMYPDVTVTVQLAGTDGNAFAIIGAVSKALRRTMGNNAADWFAREAMEQGSYDDLLAFVQSTVRVS